MPFTVSHIAAVLPGYRLLSRWHVFSAAVIGSMVPDFGFLAPWGLRRDETHGIVALFMFCLPVGLLAYWLTQLLIKPAVAEVLPDRAYARLQAAHTSSRISDLRAWLYAAIAILAGAVTHLIWDAFTHEGARGVRMFPILGAYAPEMAGHSLRLFRWLQHGSSVVGLLAVIAALTLWLRQAPRVAQPAPRRIGSAERWIWLSIYVAIPLVVATAGLIVPLLHGRAMLASSDVLEYVAVVAMRAAAVSLVLTSLLLRARL